MSLRCNISKHSLTAEIKVSLQKRMSIDFKVKWFSEESGAYFIQKSLCQIASVHASSLNIKCEGQK